MAVQGAYARNKERRSRNVNAVIDESLFGDRAGSGQRSAGGRSSRRVGKDSAVVSSSFLSGVRGGLEAPGPKNSVVVSSSDLYSMQDRSVILSAAELARRKNEKDARKNEVARRAHVRKGRMLLMEEEKRKRAPIMSEEESLANTANNKLLAAATDAMDAELDDVKHMNQMMLYAKCATIRDVQLREKARIQDQQRQEEMRLDAEMEVKRIRDIKMLEKRAAVRADEQKIGAQWIIKQIQEREAERVRQQEIRDQEAKAMIARIKQQEERDVQLRLEKVEQGRLLMEQVMRANDAQARAKLRQKQQEIEEDQRIAEYIRDKDAREAAREEEEKLIKHEKDMEVARLRAQQEKAQDRQSAIDELRARRYQEAYERQWRAKQLEVARKKEGQQREMKISREFQRQEKAKRMAEQARQDREEHAKVLEWNKQQNTVEERKRADLKAKHAGHREQLLDQILVKENEKALSRQKFLAEGKHISRQMALDKRKLTQIKEAKMRQLQEAGVPEKYQAELAKKKVLVSTIH